MKYFKDDLGKRVKRFLALLGKKVESIGINQKKVPEHHVSGPKRSRWDLIFNQFSF